MSHTTAASENKWQFSGFAFPTTTPVPDQLFDELLHRLSGAELKVLMYIIRRTYGFKKRSDDISLAQLVNGIKSKADKVLDRGTGLGKSSVARALNNLEQKNIIVRTRRRSEARGDQATTYMLNIQTPVSQNGTGGVSPVGQGVSHQRDTQQTVRQQQSVTKRKGRRSNGDGDYSKRRDIAAALVKQGIEKRVAYHLAAQYNQQRIEDNLDWLEWKQKQKPGFIKTNPAGLLRRAIEQDYASESHPNGFQTRGQKAVAASKKKKRLEAQRKLIAERKREQEASLQQKEQERTKRLEMLRERYHTTTKEQQLWQQVLRCLRKELTRLKFNIYLAQSELLSLQDGKAVINVPTRFIKAWVEDHWVAKISQALASFFNGQKPVIQILALEDVENE